MQSFAPDGGPAPYDSTARPRPQPLAYSHAG